MKITRSLALFATSLLLAASAFAADPSGQWKWTNTGPKGRSMESTLDLKVVDGKVSGTVTNRAGAEPISDAKLEGDQLSFTVTREFRGKEMTARYSGRIEGDTIKGTITGAGGSRRAKQEKTATLEWNATR